MKEGTLQEIIAFYHQIVEDTIETYFPKEGDELLLNCFRGYPQILTKTSINYQHLDTEQAIESAKEPKSYYYVANEEMEAFAPIIEKNFPKNSDEFVRKLKKFSILLSHEIFKQIELTDKEKLVLFQNQIIGLKRMIVAEDELEFESFLESKIKYITQEIELIQTQIKKPKIKVSDKWQLESTQIEKLANGLLQENFIDDVASFQQVFSKQWQVICNWNKKMTSLMYLISLLATDKHSFELDDICADLSQRITIQDKPKTYKNIRQTLRNLNERDKFKGIKMNREYSTILDIYDSVFTV